MLNFDCGKYAYASRRNVVYARHAMACTSVPLGAQIGLDIMKRGGNAMDAAVAMAAAMPLLEPTGNGLGSDAFALVWVEKEKKLYGLNASGVAPMALSAETVSLKKQLSALETENVTLTAQYERMFDRNTVKEAAEAAGMSKPGSSQIYYIDLSDGDSAVVYQQSDPGVLSRLLTSLHHGFYAVVEYFN